MFSAISRSDLPVSEAQRAARDIKNVRVRGGVSMRIVELDGVSRIADLRERDGYKVRFLRRSNPPEAIIINTGGGLAGGDEILQTIEIDDGATLTVTTQASERAYRAMDETTTRVNVTATVGENATLTWLPQETILFDRARLCRSIDVELATSARALIAETVIFGRAAMNETIACGHFSDTWRIRRSGQLVFAENTQLRDEAFAAMSKPAMCGNAHVVMTLVLVASDADDFLSRARDVIADVPFDCAASAWDGKLVVRVRAKRSEDARRMLQRLVPALDAGPLPRVWWT